MIVHSGLDHVGKNAANRIAKGAMVFAKEGATVGVNHGCSLAPVSLVAMRLMHAFDYVALLIHLAGAPRR
jgi:hypothetical protein